MSGRPLRRVAWVALASVALAGMGWAGEAFEGKMGFEMTAKQMPGGQPTATEWAVKKGLIRIQTKMGAMESIVIMNPAEKKMTTLMPAQKMAMEMAMPDATPGGEVKEPEVKKTGTTEKVAFNTEGTKLTIAKDGAKSCDGEQWTVTIDKTTSELWVAKDLPGLAGLVDVFKSMQQGAQAAAMKKVELPGFPYKTVVKDAEGNVVSEMKLTWVDTAAPADDLFTVPADYKKMEIPKMK